MNLNRSHVSLNSCKQDAHLYNPRQNVLGQKLGSLCHSTPYSVDCLPRLLLCNGVKIIHRKPTDQCKYHILHINALIGEFLSVRAISLHKPVDTIRSTSIKTPHPRLISQDQRPRIAPVGHLPEERPMSTPRQPLLTDTRQAPSRLASIPY